MPGNSNVCLVYERERAQFTDGRTASFAYRTALNHLLSRDSKQKLDVGDATTVFWSETGSSLERDVFLFFSEPPKDDPDRNTEAVGAL